MHPLWGPIKKADRAQQHLKALTTQIEGFIKSDAYGATIGQRNVKTGKYPLRALTTSEDTPPLRWSILIGEFAFNLRSALDDAACQLALTNVTAVTDIADLMEKSSFPIYLYPATRLSKPARERWSKSKAALTYMSGKHIAVLESFQPYKRRERTSLGYRAYWPPGMHPPHGTRHPLWLLHEINNADKHRLLQVTARVVSGLGLTVVSAPSDFKINGIYPRMGSQLVNGAYVGAIDIEGGWEDVQMHLRPHPEVVFWNGCPAVKGLPVIETLESILNHVQYRILSPLAKEFRPLDRPYGPPE